MVKCYLVIMGYQEYVLCSYHDYYPVIAEIKVSLDLMEYTSQELEQLQSMIDLVIII